MEVAFSFGAFGDLLQVISLIKSISEALNDARGSDKEYRHVVQRLAVIQQLVQEVDEKFLDPRLPESLASLRIIARSTIEQTRQCLERFHAKIRKYGPSLGEGGSGNKVTDMMRKIQWKLDEDAIDKFRLELLELNTSLNAILELATV
jgi:hypothetical protein